MVRVLLIPGLVVLLLGFGACHADSVTSSIVCDGAAWVSSSVLGQGQSYASHLFTTDLASLMRSLVIHDGVVVSTRGQSAGPMGIDEYSGQVVNGSFEDSECLFGEDNGVKARVDEIRLSGLFSRGEYVSSRVLDENTIAKYLVNGSGILLTRAYSDDGNRSVMFTSDVAGAMNGSEQVVFGDEYGI
ncbi:MAG: hypothetical protein BWY45_01020 [Euryarchaeota archaeon ADurb.Bin294]|jgi:hypothetical protein|nr:hypothetical protein [Methanospirillum sp.]OQA58863.1 MAG: hypothetical protein BWY45_01020 [Euryarchaeota archaeon ADurb.Bin294]